MLQLLIGIMCSVRSTYHHDHKVQPAPRVREVLDEAEGQPLHRHLHGEDDGKYLVHIVEHVLEYGSLCQINILGSLERENKSCILRVCYIVIKSKYTYLKMR